MSPEEETPLRDLDAGMRLSRESYAKAYLPVYQQMDVEPSLLVQFPVLLPFHIPFKTGTCVTFVLDGDDLCTLCFSTLTTTQGMHAGIIGPDTIQVPLHRSQVEMTYVLGGAERPFDSESELSQTFDLLVEKLNSVIVAYMVVSKDYRVQRVSKEMFEFGSIWRVIDPRTWRELGAGVFLLHWEVPFVKPELSDDEQEKIIWFANVFEKELNPFMLAEELSLSARREFLGGSYREAIVFAQTTTETFLATLLSVTLKQEGLSQDRIERLFREKGFLSRVRREYHTRFGGNWNYSGAGTPVADWYSRTYMLRNRVVHTGYRPQFGETSDALAAAEGMVRYVVGLVRQSVDRYPGLKQYFVPGASPADQEPEEGNISAEP